ncbi:MAG: hypothetical protein ACOH2F_01700 [Cellulomonas sp.]
MRIRPAAPLVLTLLTVTACTGAPSREVTPTAPASAAVELSCEGSVETGPLPAWAQVGFTPPDQPIAHVSGESGDIVGVIFGDPLAAPPVADRNNKILWVARTGGAPLRIHASLNGASLAADREVVGGPGPSTIDMPEAGCWTFALTWGENQDRVAVRYTAP